MKSIILAAAAISGLVGSAALAKPAGDVVPASTVATAAATTAPTKADSRRYCVLDAVTGSRIPIKACKSRADWAREGVDVDTLTK